jgi:hypothetical protein
VQCCHVTGHLHFPIGCSSLYVVKAEKRQDRAASQATPAAAAPQATPEAAAPQATCTKHHGIYVSGVAGPDCESGVPEAVRRGTELTDGLSVRMFAPDSRYYVRCQATDLRYL